jgi:hypothetical protein
MKTPCRQQELELYTLKYKVAMEQPNSPPFLWETVDLSDSFSRDLRTSLSWTPTQIV